jgi:hypothetical protein
LSAETTVLRRGLEAGPVCPPESIIRLPQMRQEPVARRRVAIAAKRIRFSLLKTFCKGSCSPSGMARKGFVNNDGL